MATADEEKTIIDAVSGCLEKPEALYKAIQKQPFSTIFSKKRGKHRNVNRPFEMSEIAAREILRCKDDYKVHPIQREQSYYIPQHETLAIDAKNEIPAKYYPEKLEAKRFHNETFTGFGRIIDFETPLKGKDTDKGVGDIDLLAYNEDKNHPVLTLLEYKIKNTHETLLRCVLEVYTYLKQVNKERLAEDFSESLKEGFPISPFKVDKNSEVKAAVFVHKDSLPYKHFFMGENTHIRKLMRELQVGFVSIDAEFDGKGLVKVESVKVKVEEV
ncbi:MAG: hypothetical protein LBC63_07000 [Holophagales bacterium]|nr:hypothetical protein [Holophagales bacterium]